jgi:hypothetical protein
MKHATTCKFCRKPLVLETDDEYTGLGDPFKIIPLTACNSCADVRSKISRLEERIARLCGALLGRAGRDKTDDIRSALSSVTNAYAYAITELNHAKEVLTDPEFTRLLMDKPDKWAKILTNYRRMCRRDFGRQAA